MYVPCDESSIDPNAMICVEDGKTDECPITDITFNIDADRV